METAKRAEDRLLKPADVRKNFGVAASTLREWARAGKIRTAQHTIGGHRRFRESDVRALLAELTDEANIISEAVA